MAPRLPKHTPALFAVLDDKMPSIWKPWGTMAIADLREEISVVDPTALSPYEETFTPGLIAEPEKKLLNLGNWSGIVGAVVDATRLPRPDIRTLHKELCARVGASGNPLCKRVGYYLIFCVRDRTITEEHRTFFNDLKLDAKSRLKLTEPKAASTFRVTSDDTLRNALQNFVEQMRSASIAPD